MLKALITLLFLLLSTEALQAQWTKLAQWDSVEIFQIHFLDSVGTPNIGFISLPARDPEAFASIWRTSDYGNSWRQVSTTRIHAMSFAFKDSLLGWAAGSNAGCTGFAMRTRDGGLTWSSIGEGFCPSGLFYHHASSRLFMSNSITPRGLLYSTDEGDTWIEVDQRGFGAPSLSNDGTLILPGIGFSVPYSPFMYSRDGVTWHESNFQGLSARACNYRDEDYALAQTNDYRNVLIKSTDHGVTWNEVIKLDGDLRVHTAFLTSNNCGLYMQTYYATFRSRDAGLNWENIGSIGSWRWGQLTSQQNMIYCPRIGLRGDSIVPAELWRYIEPVELTVQNPLVFESCEIDTSVTLTYNADCFEGELISAEIIQPSDRFTLGNLSLPQDVSGDFSIPFHYSSLGPGATDNASLKLRFRAGAYIFDTVISITAQSGAGGSSVGFTTRVSNASPKTSERVTVGIYPTKAVTSLGLKEISFDLSYQDDIFQFNSINGPQQPAITNQTLSAGLITMPIVINASDMTLDPNVPITEIELTTTVTELTSTAVTLANVKLNGGDQEYALCKLALEASTSAGVTVALQCGDESMRRLMRGEKAIAIKSINPNPTNGNITVDYDSKLSGAVTLSVYSVGGVLVHEEVLAADRPALPLQLDASGWPSGAYTIVLKSGEDEARGGVIKN